MDQLFEIIGPVAFILFIAIGKLLEIAFKGKGGQPDQRQTRRPSTSDAQEVQDKIRRLIMERAGIEMDGAEDDGFGEKPKPVVSRPVFQEPEPVVFKAQPSPPPKPAVPPSALQHFSNEGAYAMGPRHGIRRTSHNLKKLGLDKPGALKRAILLQEILDKPLALRQGRPESW